MSGPTINAEAEILSDLAHKLVDQIALYGLAKEIARDPKIADMIQRAKVSRAELLQEINAKIWQHDIPAIAQGDKLGTAQKAFQRLRDLTEKDDRAAVAEVERGEDYLRDRIQRGIDDDRLSAHTQNYLQSVFSRVETTHQQFSELKHSL